MDLPFDTFPPERVKTLNPLQLAYMGDTVYDLFVRAMLLGECDGAVRKLHALSSGLVCAKAQARALGCVEDMLNDDERDIVRRGRNAHAKTIPKNADPADYAKATALEALVGYLYLTRRYERLRQIIGAALDRQEEDGTCPE